MDTWLTRKEAAAWLKTSTATITNIVHEMERFNYGGIYRRGGILRINEESMSSYMKQRKKIKKNAMEHQLHHHLR